MENKHDFELYKGSLSHLALKVEDSLGRRYKDDPDECYFGVINPFLIDREKIRNGKFYRRLENKTQVFPPSAHSNIRNRLIHTNDVVSLSAINAEILGLNVYLAEAMSYGHDIGHTPMGHTGEKFIRLKSGKSFAHSIMSVIVAQYIERKGFGLNLTYETLEGMYNHSRGAGTMTISKNVSQEATLVMYSDKIAYTFSDINDAVRVGFIKEDELPTLFYDFGKNQRERNAKASYELIKESSEEGKISFEKSDYSSKFEELKKWMYKNVYFKLNEQIENNLFNRLEVSLSLIKNKFEIDPYLALACMTNDEVNFLSSNKNLQYSNLNNLGFVEIINNLKSKDINIFDLDLNPFDFHHEYL